MLLAFSFRSSSLGYLSSSRGSMLQTSMSSTPQIVSHQIPRVQPSASQGPFMLRSPEPPSMAMSHSL